MVCELFVVWCLCCMIAYSIAWFAYGAARVHARLRMVVWLRMALHDVVTILILF